MLALLGHVLEDVPTLVPMSMTRLTVDIVRGVDGSPGLIDVLPRLQERHRLDLVRVERWTSGDLARHPEPRELIRSRRKPGNLDEMGRLILRSRGGKRHRVVAGHVQLI